MLYIFSVWDPFEKKDACIDNTGLKYLKAKKSFSQNFARALGPAPGRPPPVTRVTPRRPGPASECHSSANGKLYPLFQSSVFKVRGSTTLPSGRRGGNGPPPGR
jgi:hypothetical protein